MELPRGDHRLDGVAGLRSQGVGVAGLSVGARLQALELVAAREDQDVIKAEVKFLKDLNSKYGVEPAKSEQAWILFDRAHFTGPRSFSFFAELPRA